MSIQPFDASNPEVARLKARLAAAESECRAREEVQARLIRERNAAEAEADRARGLRVEENIVVEAAILWAERRSDDLSSAVNLLEAVNALLRKRAHLASRPEGEVRDGR